DVADALRCAVPMGVNGCGFESQLESSYLALARAQLNTEASYGFLRSDASLLVLILSDEIDCSYNKNYSTIFSAEGNKAFWSDPSSPYPTSALCWNAGVMCMGPGSGYVTCDPQNYDVDGNPTGNPDDAVLHPISRYINDLDQLRQQREQINPGARVRFAVIGGARLDGTVHYADSPDPGFQNSFGIGPGCEDPNSPEVLAVPPVRMRQVALQSDGSLGSICAPDYSPFLADLVESFVAECG